LVVAASFVAATSFATIVPSAATASSVIEPSAVASSIATAFVTAAYSLHPYFVIERILNSCPFLDFP